MGHGDVTIFGNAGGTIWNLVETLRMHVAGGIAMVEDLVIVVYPGGMEAWNFLETDQQRTTTASTGPDTKLRLQVIRASKPQRKDESRPGPVVSSARHAHNLQSLFKYLYHVDYKLLLTKPTPHDPRVTNFMVIAPSSVTEEVALYLDFLKASGAKNIHTSAQKGAWDYFRDQYSSGTILVLYSNPFFQSLPSRASFVDTYFHRSIQDSLPSTASPI